MGQATDAALHRARAGWSAGQRRAAPAALCTRGHLAGVLGCAFLVCAVVAAHHVLLLDSGPWGPRPAPPPGASIAARVAYERALVADADYQLALVPRVLRLGLWRITILPAQPNLQAAWQDAQDIAAVAPDQPDVLADVQQIHRVYLRQQYLVSLSWQTHVPYTPDYTEMGSWFDFMAGDSTADLAQAPTTQPAPASAP
jgi:hypothetical protein